jgi:integrase/recombinase XerD
MPRAGQRIKTRKPMAVKPSVMRKASADALAHNRLVRYMEDHFEWMLVTGYSADTVRARRQALRKFIAWADERGLDDPREITRPMLERYQRFLYYYRKPGSSSDGKDAGEPLTIGMQYQYLAPLKTWFRWLSREHHILANPAADLDLPRQPKRLPRSVPSVQEVEAILAEAEPETAQGLRDRALLEVLYATGLRRMELAGAAVYDVDIGRGILWVRHGKGGRERVVPLGERARAWLDKYLTEARPQLLGAQDVQGRTALFVNDYGEPAHADFISGKVKRYMAFAGVEKVGSAHLLRHACATHMLEGGADIRFIQEMLGHANLQTTEIYTHVSIDKLIAVHKATHPSRLQRRRGDEAPVAGPSLDEAREALLSAIAADSDDEREDGADAVAADAWRRR